MKTVAPETNAIVAQPEDLGSSKIVMNAPTEMRKIEIPIIPPRDNASYEETIGVVRVRHPVKIDRISVLCLDSGGYMVEMPGGKVSFAGATQELYVANIEDALQLIAHAIGQTTYEYYEVDEDEWEDRKRKHRLYQRITVGRFRDDSGDHPVSSAGPEELSVE
jgi:hypothetical protein